MTNRNKLGSKLFILIAVLLFAWVGVSCKNKNVPGGEGGMDLNKPDDTDRTKGNVDDKGLLPPDKQNAFNDEMLLIQLLAVSEDGGYYRNPVVAAVNGNDSGKIITVMEKRYGKFTLNDVAVDGSTKVELVYLVSEKAGSGITPGSQPAVVGKGVSNDPRTQSRGVPVVFTKKTDSSVLVVAAGGTGFVGTAKGDKDGSKIYTISGTLAGTSVNWKNEGEIKIVVTNSENKVTTNGTEAILTYAREKFKEPKVNSVYLSSGVGVVDGSTYVLPLVVSHVDNQGYVARDAYFGTVVIYSEDGQTWHLGAYRKPEGQEWAYGGYSSTYREAKGIVIPESSKITIAARPNCYYHYPVWNIGLYTGDYKEQTELRISTGVEDAMGSFEFTSNGADYYLINTRDRETSVYNKKLVIATTDKGATTSVKEMIMTAVSGGGSAVALSDNSIITICEEAFVLGSTREERKFNLVLRRFTKGYLEKNMNIPKKDRYYNPSYDLGDAGFNYPINPNREEEKNN